MSSEGKRISVVDVYDALISERVYKQPIAYSEAVEIIRRGRGVHFDPLIADIFIMRQDKIRFISI